MGRFFLSSSASPQNSLGSSNEGQCESAICSGTQGKPPSARPDSFCTHVGQTYFHLLKPPGEQYNNMSGSEIDSLQNQPGKKDIFIFQRQIPLKNHQWGKSDVRELHFATRSVRVRLPALPAGAVVQLAELQAPKAPTSEAAPMPPEGGRWVQCEG